MKAPLALLKFVAKSALNAVSGGFGGDFLDMCRDIWTGWGKDRSEDQRKADLQALVQAPADEVKQQVKEVVREVAADRPAEVQLQLETYLNQVPTVTRQSLRRSDDPSGRTVPPSMTLQKAEDLATILPRPPRFKPGDRPLPGVNWELEKLLGAGGFGEVWKAHHPTLTGITAALKFCLDPEAAATLPHEAKTLNRVMQAGRHDGIVPLRQAYLDSDPICLEYEFVEGDDLAGAVHAHLASKRPLTPDMGTKIVLHLARAVGHVHKLSPPIVHRDLKPANVLVRRREGRNEFLITDFGIGGVAASQALEQTRQGTTSQPMLPFLKGAHTPLYASPEQKRGEPPDPRDDVHALGVIWYQLLIGDFTQGAPTGGIWKKELRGRGVSDKQVELIESCFEARAADRPPNAAVVAEQIEETRKPPPVVSPPPPPPVVGPVSAPPQPPQQDHLADASAALARSDFGVAIASCNQALKADPPPLQAYRLRARAYVGKKKFDLALKDLNSVLAGPEATGADFVERGRLFVDQGKLDKAVWDFTEALTRDRGSFDAYVARARAYVASGSWELAFADFDAALKIAPQAAEVFYHRGEAHEQRKEHDRALADYSEAIRLDPAQARFFNARGSAYHRKGEADLALADLIRAIHLDPGLAEAYHNRGQVYSRKGDFEQAVADYTQAIQRGLKSGRVYYHRGLTHARLQKPAQAIADFTRAIKVSPRNPELYLMRGLAHYDTANYDAAIANFTQAIQRDKGYTAAYQNRGRAYLASGKYGKAVNDFTRVIGHNPKRADAFDGRAWARCLKKQFDQAIADATEAIRLNPVCASACFHRSRAHAGKGELVQAVADATEAVRLDPQPAHYEARGLAHHERGEYDPAIADFTEAIRLDPKNAALYRSRARAYAKKGDSGKAQTDRGRADKLTPAAGQQTPLSPAGKKGKAEKTQRGGQVRAERYDLRKRFWEGLLARAAQKTPLHANISPGEYHWLGTSSGIRGLGFNYAILKDKGKAELYIDRGDAATNKDIFDKLHALKAEIEKAFGGGLSWQRLDGKRGCRIAHTITVGGWKSDESQWPSIQDAMIDAMVRLEKAINPHLTKLKVEGM